MSAGQITTIQNALTRRFRHRCTIVRPSGGHAWDSEGTDSTVVSNQVCHYDDGASRETILVDGTRIVKPALLFLPRDVAVNEGDRITAVTDQLSQSLVTESRGITSVRRFASHQECSLEGSGT